MRALYINGAKLGKKMKTNTPPTYHAEPYKRPETNEIVPRLFSVYEDRFENGTQNSSFCFKISYCGDLFQQLLKRGLPEDAARKVFYEMDEK